MGLVQLLVTLIFFSKRGTMFCLLSFSPNFPLSHFYDYKYLLLFLQYWLTYPWKWYLFHPLVFSPPVCPFHRLNSETVAKQLYITAASHQLLIVLSTSALQIWTACMASSFSGQKHTQRFLGSVRTESLVTRHYHHGSNKDFQSQTHPITHVSVVQLGTVLCSCSRHKLEV